MSEPILIDTDVLIDYMRGHPDAVSWVDTRMNAQVSVVTVAELYSGARDAEMEKLRALLATFPHLPVTEEIAVRGGLFRRQHGKAIRIEVPDALIAATAQEHGLKLATLNRKHFPAVDVVAPYTKR
ncbi:type II toxin-antitoxin system VapC family toxin [Longimicrobium sp.]|uniref:type II toxin-antitoxin system VapC family toxin n=1 Tax=Longimicrobium sp. TaxID=2029185 RepID=UPI002B610654|nr:type II toxin-antitoxin system VapC family toxin [Longimicrobium sp.]HSU16936.1 type II toxin-antitoxin system VapC family toxin [Longimicrobium sp.]